MSRNTNLRTVKPTLEQLEERAQPSILLGGGVQQLAAPLNNMVTDMQSARTDLQTQFTLLHTMGTSGVGTSVQGQAEVAFGKGAADWQRMLNDQAAIQAISTADVNFLRTAAFAEFSAGDPTDLILITFGRLIGFDPTRALTDPVTTANNLVNDPTVHTWVTTDFFLTSPLFTHNTFSQETVTPSFT